MNELNAEAEAWLADQPCTSVEKIHMREAMRWAYADSCRIAREEAFHWPPATVEFNTAGRIEDAIRQRALGRA